MRTIHARWQRRANVLFVTWFLLLISLPAVRLFLDSTPTVLAAEQRKPAPMPELRLKSASLRGFPERFDSFFNDRFGFRATLLRMLSSVRTRGLATSPSPKVIMGKDGWLFGAELPSGVVRPFTTDELVRWQTILENRNDWLANRGIRFVFVIAPNKQSVYPEFVPEEWACPQIYGTRLDQLVTHLRAHSTVPIVDLRAALLAAKAHERLYDRTDTHWNDRGAYVAYGEIIKVLAFPALTPESREHFEEAIEHCSGGDLARMIDGADWMREECLVLRRRSASQVRLSASESSALPEPRPFALERDDSSLPPAVCFCDSFAVRLAPFLGQHFHRMWIHWQMIYPTFEIDVILREKPQVVIQEMVECKLVLPVPEPVKLDPLASQPATWQNAAQQRPTAP
jgi:hypothetical protein